MRTIIETKEVYTYDELSDSAKQAVKDWYLTERSYFGDFDEMVTEDLRSIFGDNMLDVQYSLGYSQGDGLNIYGKINAKKILDFMGSDVAGELSKKYSNVLSNDDKNKIRQWCDKYGDIHYDSVGIIMVPKNPYRYSYCVSDMIEFADDWATELYYYGIEDTDVLAKFEQACRDLFKELCNMYERWGYEYFYEIEDDEMSEICSANEWEFYKDGQVL